MKRRQFLISAGVSAGTTLWKGKGAMANESSAKEFLARIQAPVSDRVLALPGFTSLEFRTALPEGLDWFESPEPVVSVEDTGMFTKFDRIWLGYRPEERDRLQVSVYCARIIPERVALATDYARLLAQKWGPNNYGVYGGEINFGEVMTGEDDSGFQRRTRISIWRRGLDLLILRMDTTLEDFTTTSAKMATMIGSVNFVTEVNDPIVESLRFHELTLPSGGVFKYPLPSHWKLFGRENAGAIPVSGDIWLDKADMGGNSAIGIFTADVPRANSSENAPLQETATIFSELMMENLLPQAEYSRKSMAANRVLGFKDDTAQGFFIERLDWPNGRKQGSVGFFMLVEGNIVGYSSLSAYPDSDEAIAISMHANYVNGLVLDALRRQFGTLQTEAD